MAGENEEEDRKSGAAAEEGSDKESKEKPLVGVSEETPEKKDEEESGDDDRGGDDDDREDTRMGRSEDDDDEFPRGRDPRGLTRKEKNERRRKAQERDRTEIRFLRARNEQLERAASANAAATTENAKRLAALEKSQNNERISRLRSAIRNADQTIVRLTAEGEAAQAVEATGIKADLQAKLDEEIARQRAVDERREAADQGDDKRGERKRGERQELPPEVLRNIDEWRDRNPWFNLEKPGVDERIVHALDAQLLEEGFDPSTREYYRELDKLIAEKLPHRAAKRGRGRDRDDDDRDDRDERRTRDRDDDRDRDRDTRGRDRDRDNGDRGGKRQARGPKFKVGGVERELRSNEVYLNKERREALEQMGADGDPVLMQRYLKAYKKYDEEEARRKNNR